MKIFHWMQRKFHLKDEFGRNAKKDELIAKDTDTEALLENVAIDDIIDGWKGGLLAIGTLGFDPLQHFIDQDQEYQFSVENGEESEEEDEYSANEYEEYCWDKDMHDEELDPLVCPTITPSLGGSNHDDQIVAEANMIMNIHDCSKPLSATNGGIGFKSEDLDQSSSDNGKSNKRQRITLADLFSADRTDEHKKPNLADEDDGDGGDDDDKPTKFKTSVQGKHGLSFAKKLIPRVSDDSRPIHKLHQLLTRMLKRKIHPDIEVKNYKTTTHCKPSMLRLLSNKHGHDSVSLLQTQDVEI